jgi:hypothetical protein
VARQHRLFRKWPAVPGLLGLLVTFSGCPLTPDDSGGGSTDVRFTAQRNTIEGTLLWVAQSWEQKRFPEYQQVLHDQFEFFPRDDDLIDFPWLQGASWGRTDELDIARNMFDANYSGQERPVDTVEFKYTITDQRNVLDANQNVIGVEVRCDADVTVLIAADNGWFSDTRFVFLVVEDPRNPGLYQIKEQREIQIL